MTRGPRLVIDTGAPGVRAAFTNRAGGVSAPPRASLNVGTATGDAPERVRENRAALAAALGFDPAPAVVLRQVHGSAVYLADDRGGRGAFTGTLEGVADADAAATSHPGIALMVMGADCPMVLAWTVDGARVAAAARAPESCALCTDSMRSGDVPIAGAAFSVTNAPSPMA